MYALYLIMYGSMQGEEVISLKSSAFITVKEWNWRAVSVEKVVSNIFPNVFLASARSRL